jgi:glycosyltransferase involved in cell wall biosynthesis
MKRFAYICADPGIPIPGTKGSSIHVASVCKALVSRGLEGTVHATRRESAEVSGVPIMALGRAETSAPSAADREVRLFLSSFTASPFAPGGCDFVYERYSLWHAAGLARARALGVPFILEVNSPLPDEAEKFRSLAHRELANGIAELLIREADGLVCVSEAVAEWVASRRKTDDGVWLVPNGVDAEIFSPQASGSPGSGSDSDALLVAFAGSFRPWHGVDDLLNAFRLVVEQRCPAARLICVGDGPLRGSLQEQVDRAGLADRVQLPGAVPQSEVARLLREARVAVAPYPAIEPFYFSPLKVFEFMSLGLPVVTADVQGMRDLVPHGLRGLLYEAGNIQALADSIGRLLVDDAEARRIGSNGREWVLANATWDRRVESILEKIERLGARVRDERRVAL